MFLVAKCIACTCIFQTNSCCDITSVNDGDFLTAVSVHLQNTADTLTFVLSSVNYIRTGFQDTGVYTEEREFTYIRVCHDFKCQC
ncbi:hypothetical protein D3C86_1996810 [compost metagenome]